MMKRIGFIVLIIIIILSVIYTANIVRYKNFSKGYIEDGAEVIFYSQPTNLINYLDKDGNLISSKPVFLLKEFWIPAIGYYVEESSFFITWAVGGERIATRLPVINSEWGYPAIIESDGKVIQCPQIISPFGKGRVWIISGDIILEVQIAWGYDELNKPDSVILYDLEKCETNSVLYTAGNTEHINEATLSSTGILAIGFYTNGGDVIRMLDKNGTIYQEIEGAKTAAWSKDGSYLAYVKDGEGIFVYDVANLHEEKIVDWQAYPDEPAWSDDGKQLIYVKTYEHKRAIYIVDIGTHEEHLFYYDANKSAIFPYLRWK